MAIIYENQGEMRNVLTKGSSSGASHTQDTAALLTVFDSPYNISQILKFIPFYERLVLRVVNSRWNLSFFFPGCWESVDYRFLDLRRYSFYLKNFRRFIFYARRLDICVDQISDFFNLISSPFNACVNSQCVAPKSSSKVDLDSTSSADTADPLDSNSLYSSDSESDYSFSNSDSNLGSNLDSFSLSDPLPPLHHSHSPTASPSPFSINNALNDLKRTLILLKGLNILQISDKRTKHNSIFTRVSPIVSSFIDSFNYSNCSSSLNHSSCNLSYHCNNTNHRYNPIDSCSIGYPGCSPSCKLNNDNNYFMGPTSIIIDCPVNLNFILGLIPFSRNIVNLVISRIIDSNPNFSVCSIVSELVEHIPPGQLQCLQIGKTVPTYSDPNSLSFSPEADMRRSNRLRSASALFGPSVELEEGDELLCLLLANHSQSLSILVVSLLSHLFQLEDIDLSFTAYHKIRNFKCLKHTKIPVWSGLDQFFPSNYSL